MDCVISLSLSLLAVIAGMHLIAKTYKENLSRYFRWITYLIVLLGFAGVVCALCQCFCYIGWGSPGCGPLDCKPAGGHAIMMEKHIRIGGGHGMKMEDCCKGEMKEDCCKGGMMKGDCCKEGHSVSGCDHESEEEPGGHGIGSAHHHEDSLRH